MLANSLPVVDPLINVYPKHAIPLTLLSLDKHAEQWIYSNYIQLKCSKDFMNHTPQDWFDFFTVYPEFYENPYLHTERITIDTINNLDINIINFVINSIDNGSYIYTHVDEYYISDTVAHNSFHLPHAILIYGYNKGEKILNIAGFNKIQKYSFRTVDFSHFEKAFYKIADYKQEINSRHKNYFKFSYLMKLNQVKKYDFDISWVFDCLKDYIESKNTSGRFRGFSNIVDDYYGLETYSKLIDYYSSIPEDKRYLDIRPAHLLWEHKKIMFKRIQYIEKNKIANVDGSLKVFEEIERISLNLRNILIKYTFNNDNSLIDKIITLLNTLETKEGNAIQKLLQEN
ncbi:hypothetical protein [Brevibacillus sp. DP1.3A]|uniref:hypothetical protein n=1 Tax=Brevibacillus sp. DP1.3A TaxID=2738867 RepID=UPI00156B9DD4|nr:hypothetical protein [Brevibacillus sp. DP1.3A]UED72207.1 hypothetical protein HP399_015670 [Brevibacillus sp. DP1.3A]